MWLYARFYNHILSSISLFFRPNEVSLPSAVSNEQDFLQFLPPYPSPADFYILLSYPVCASVLGKGTRYIYAYWLLYSLQATIKQERLDLQNLVQLRIRKESSKNIEIRLFTASMLMDNGKRRDSRQRVCQRCRHIRVDIYSLIKRP